jgi:PAS domain S-box-containing protein
MPGSLRQRWHVLRAHLLRLASEGALARGCGGVAALIGAVYLALWSRGLPVAWSTRGAITMKTNMALALVLAGAALALLAHGAAPRWRRALGAAAAGLVLLIGALALAEHVLHLDLGLDQLLASEPPGQPGVLAPNRMGPPGASTLTLLGAGLLLLAARRRAAAMAGALAFCLQLVPATGLLYGVTSLHSDPTFTGIAGVTVLALLLLAVGLATAPSGAELPLPWRNDPGGLLLRRMVVPAVALPPALGLLRLEGEARGLYDTRAGTALFAVTLAALFLLLLWRSAVALSAASTRSRRAAEAIRASEARFRALFENLPDAVFLTIPDGRIVAANPAACSIFGSTEEELVRGGREALIDPTDPRQRAFAEELRRTKRAAGWELTFVRKGGARFPGEASSAVMGDGGSAFVLVRDVTARRQAEHAARDASERLLETDRRKDEFLGMLSHELRNPLAPIRNALYLLDHAPPGGQQARRARDIANRQVAHLTRLVDDLLDVTRIARGKVELRHEVLDLAGLVRRTAEDYRPLMQDRGVDLAVVVPSDPALVNGDPARLTQVLGNLLNNAGKFTPTGGRVVLSLRREGDRAVVHVADSGPGIAPELLPMLFEPFTQGKQTLARTEGGLGLGLSLVKGFVALHGGEVTVSSRPGGGADFAVSLALARPGATTGLAAETALPSAPAAGPRHRVLVVDDNRDAAETLGDLVRMLGHDVELAFDGPSALAEAGRTHPDLVLCDLGLPGMDGYQVARELRARHEGALRLVALSGYAQPEDVSRALASGFDRHVAKPPDPGKIEALLR